MASRCLERFITASKHPRHENEVLEERNNVPTKIRLNKEKFEKYLRTSVFDGVSCLEVEFIKTVNSDFTDKAYNWLKEEVDKKLNSENEFVLLDDFSVKKDSDKVVLARLN